MQEVSKLLFHVILLAAAIPVVGQTQQGAVLTGGSIRFNFDNVKQEIGNDNSRLGTETTLEFSPRAGYFVDDGIAIGLMLDWQRQAFKDNEENRQIDHSVSVGPFARYYTALGPFFHVQAGIGGGASKEKPDIGDEAKIIFKQWSYGAGIGYPYFLGDHTSVEPVILFRSLNQSGENRFGEEVTVRYRGLMIQIGLVYYIF